jgi:hypothetical protein
MQDIVATIGTLIKSKSRFNLTLYINDQQFNYVDGDISSVPAETIFEIIFVADGIMRLWIPVLNRYTESVSMSKKFWKLANEGAKTNANDHAQK